MLASHLGSQRNDDFTYTFKRVQVFISKAVIHYAETKVKYFKLYYSFGKYPNTSFDFDSKVMKFKALSQ